jgi:hypothetical protein
MLEEANGKAAMKERETYKSHKRFRDGHETPGIPSVQHTSTENFSDLIRTRTPDSTALSIVPE